MLHFDESQKRRKGKQDQNTNQPQPISPFSPSSFTTTVNPFLPSSQQQPSPFVTSSFTTTVNPFLPSSQQSQQPFVTPNNVGYLQSTVGNRVVNNMLQGQNQSGNQTINRPKKHLNNNQLVGLDDFDGPDPDTQPLSWIGKSSEEIGELSDEEMTLKQHVDKKREYVGHTGKIMSVKNVAKRLTSPFEHGKVKETAGYAEDYMDDLMLWANSEHREQIEELDWHVNPWTTGNLLNERFPKGPLLTPAEMKFILELSQSRTGQLWLSGAGMASIAKAAEFLKAHKYQKWLKLEASYRILLASLAWSYRNLGGLTLNDVIHTPPYRLGRSMEIRQLPNDDDELRTRKEQLRHQVDQDIRKEWLGTFVGDWGNEVGPGKDQERFAPNVKEAIEAGAMSKKGGAEKGKTNPDEALFRHAAANEILKKVLLILHAGMKLYNKKKDRHEDYTGAVARALSHGGRVNVRIPALADKNENAYALTDWLGVTKGGKMNTESDSPVFSRGFGTHHMEIGKNEKRDGERVAGTGSFRETGSTTASIKNKGNTQIFGVNLAVGGIGKLDFNGDVILPDGAHGHLFIGFRPPELKKDGALQIGIETTAPGASSTVGYHHGPESSEATANPESSFGGLKQDKVGDQVTPGAKLTKSSTTIKEKQEKISYDFGKYKARKEKIKSEDEDGGKKTVEDRATLGRYVNLTQIKGGNWLGHLQDLEKAFDTLHEKQGAVDAYSDLIGEGRLIKRTMSHQKKMTDLENF